MLPIPLFISCLWRSEPPARDHLQTLRVPAAPDGNSRPTAGWGLHPQHCNCASQPLQACIPSIATVYPRHCNCASPPLQACIPGIATVHPQHCNCASPAMQLVASPALQACIPSTATVHLQHCNYASPALHACIPTVATVQLCRRASSIMCKLRNTEERVMSWP